LLSTNYGGLVPEDELLTHQIVDTFATVSQSDPSWTEKIWTIAHARDNSLQVVLGISTLVLAVPLPLALGHQALAFMLAGAIGAWLADITPRRA
jgi:heme A synthase